MNAKGTELQSTWMPLWRNIRLLTICFVSVVTALLSLIPCAQPDKWEDYCIEKYGGVPSSSRTRRYESVCVCVCVLCLCVCVGVWVCVCVCGVCVCGCVSVMTVLIVWYLM